MAIGKASDFTIYQAEFHSGFSETLQQNAAVWNAQSNGAIQLVPREIVGEYEKRTFFDVISTLVSRRDLTSVAAATDLAMTDSEIASVKVARTIGPVAQTLDAWRKIGGDASEMSFRLGSQIAQAVSEDYLNTGLNAAAHALVAETALFEDDTAATITTIGLKDALGRFGDASQRIVAWVMHSKVFFDLLGDQIANYKIDSIGGFVVAEAMPVTLGRPVIVTDSASLYNDIATDTYDTLGLVQGALVITESEGREIVSEMVTGLDNLVMRVQGEYSFNVELKGFTYDIANGGANPTDAAIATATNWDKAVTSDKLMAGVALQTL